MKTMTMTKEQAMAIVSEYRLDADSSISEIIDAICNYLMMASYMFRKKDLCSLVRVITDYIVNHVED